MFDTALRTQFANLLKITDANELILLGWCLDSLDEYFTQKGLIWTNTNTIATKKFFSRDDSVDFFCIQPVQPIGLTLTIKNTQNLDSKALILETDYSIYQYNLATNPVFQVNLQSSIFGTEYLEISGVWKFGELLPSDVKMVILSVCSDFITNNNSKSSEQTGKTITSTRVGEVAFTFGKTATENFSQNSELKRIVSKYLPTFF